MTTGVVCEISLVSIPKYLIDSFVPATPIEKIINFM
jgi:hypothetical protein